MVFPKEINKLMISSPEEEAMALARLRLITAVALSACEQLDKKNFRAFDALVGETSCQLRAHAIQQMASDPAFVTALAQVQQKLSYLLKRLDGPFSLIISGKEDHTVYCRKVLKECSQTPDPKGLHGELATPPELSQRACFLILSHFLYLTRDCTNPQRTNAQQLVGLLRPVGREVDKERDAIDTKCCELIVKSVKRALAQASVEFISNETKNDPEYELFYKALFKTSVESSCDLICAPCFPCIDFILYKAQKDRRPIALVIEKEDQRYVVPFAVRERKYVVVEAGELTQQPVLIFKGVSTHPAEKASFIAELLGKEDPFGRACEMIRMNAAAHPQYAGSKKELSVALLEKGKDFGEKIREKINPFVHSSAEVDKVMKENCIAYELKVAQEQCKPAPLAEVVRQYLRLKALAERAKEEGCTREKTGGFSLQHIYCSTLEGVLQERQVISGEE
jgi:hypothetical protein